MQATNLFHLFDHPHNSGQYVAAEKLSRMHSSVRNADEDNSRAPDVYDDRGGAI